LIKLNCAPQYRTNIDPIL